MSKVKNAIKTFKEFHWTKATELVNKKFPMTDGSKLVYIGTMTVLEYVSDKFDGKTRIHVHKFESPQLVFTNPSRSVIILLPTKIDSTGIRS